jgi:hypothetical protein
MACESQTATSRLDAIHLKAAQTATERDVTRPCVRAAKQYIT